MYFTNNCRTIYNLTLYSKGTYNERNLHYKVFSPRWDFSNYHSVKPYGNINKDLEIAYSNKLTIVIKE